MTTTNPSLMEEANVLLNAALEVQGTLLETELLEDAAKMYEMAGSPEDAAACRDFIESAATSNTTK